MYDSGKVRTELVWDGKRTRVDIIELPFQTIEVVNEPRKKSMDSYFGLNNTEWYNRLIWGDNKLVMSSLLKEFAGKIDLIYIDPPFATGADFSMPIKVEESKFTKEPSAIEIKVYRDTWGKGLASYLQMMYDRLVLMRELLSDKGSIYVHLDYHVGHYVKIIMDEIFGKENFRNEIVWFYKTGGVSKKEFPKKHDVLYLYSKTENMIFNTQKEKSYIDYKYGFSNVVIKEDDKGYYTETYVRDVWDIDALRGNHPEYLNFPTQKPEKLLERIIKATSNEGDLVADFFCGSGTTLAVAEKLNRRWIGCDLSKFAIHVTRKRLLEIEGCKPFVIQNLGKYQKYKFIENGNGIKDYINFVLRLYNADQIKGYAYIHGKKGNRLVHIGSIESFVTLQEIENAVRESIHTNAKGLDILGWDFEMGLHDLIDNKVKEFGIDIKLKQIPINILDIKANKQRRLDEEIKFFDLNYLDLDVKKEGKAVTVSIKRFCLANPEYIPNDIRQTIKDFMAYIDYWAVDFNYDGHTFHNMRQIYRTKEKKRLDRSITHEYANHGKYDILVKVVDILGNDTNKLISIEV